MKMNFLKKTIYAAATALAMAAYPAAVNAAKTPRPVNVETAAMAGMDTVVGNDLELLTNPALMDRRGTKFSIPGLNLMLSDPREVIDAADRYKDFFDGMDSLQDGEKADHIQNFMDSEDEQSVLVGLSLVPSFQLSTGIGTFGVAGYGASESRGVLNPGSLEGLLELQKQADAVRAGKPSESREFVLEKPIDLVSVSDAGAAVGYAKNFPVSLPGVGALEIAGGLGFRGFERFKVNFAPSPRFVLEGAEVTQDGVEGPDGKVESDLEPEVVRGRGYALDMGSVLRKDFGPSDLLVGVSLGNVWSNTISYSDGTSAKDGLRYGVGLASHPLEFLPVLDDLLLAAEMHGSNGNRTFHAGASLDIGGSFGVKPMVGVQFGSIDPRGEYIGSRTMTAGAVFKLVVAKLAASYAYDTESKHMFGLGLTFGYEWDK